MKGSFSLSLQDILSFTRCERPDGTFYGTGGTCRKGTTVGDKEKPPLKEAVVQGRFNLSHKGHATFIAKVLNKAEKVTVIVSSLEGERPGGHDGKSGNLNWNFRVLMLRRALKVKGVDINRVNFVKDSSPDEEIKRMIKRNNKSEVGVFLGKDERNGVYAKELAKKYGISGGLIEANDEEGKVSSTRIRQVIDRKDWVGLQELMEKDPYLVRLAVAGRGMELE
jgi:cytidyltransferase-like protein